MKSNTRINLFKRRATRATPTIHSFESPRAKASYHHRFIPARAKMKKKRRKEKKGEEEGGGEKMQIGEEGSSRVPNGCRKILAQDSRGWGVVIQIWREIRIRIDDFWTRACRFLGKGGKIFKFPDRVEERQEVALLWPVIYLHRIIIKISGTRGWNVCTEFISIK